MRSRPDPFTKTAYSSGEDSEPSAIRKLAPYAVGAAGLGAGLLAARRGHLSASSSREALEAAKNNLAKQKRQGLLAALGAGALGLVGGAAAVPASTFASLSSRLMEAEARAAKQSARADSFKARMSDIMKGRDVDLDHAKMQAEAQMKKQSHVDAYRKYASIARQNDGLLKVAQTSSESLAYNFASELEKISAASASDEESPLISKENLLEGAALGTGAVGAGLAYREYAKRLAAKRALAEAAEVASARRAKGLAMLGGLAGSALLGLAGAAVSPLKRRVHSAAEGLGEKTLSSMGFPAPVNPKSVPLPNLRPNRPKKKRPILYDAKGNPIP